MTTVLAITAAVAGCGRLSSEEHEEDTRVDARTERMMLWDESMAVRISPTVLKLRNGQCLDMARLPEPWALIANDQPRSFTVAAPSDEIGIKTFASGWSGEPEDGRLRITLSGWAPDPEDFDSPFLTQKQAEEAVATGVLIRSLPWGARADLVAYSNPEATDSEPIHYYLSRAGRTDCKQLGNIWCRVTSDDDYVRYGFHLASTEVATLPKTLQKLAIVVETTRGDCPFPASSVQ